MFYISLQMYAKSRKQTFSDPLQSKQQHSHNNFWKKRTLIDVCS
jgi:hypothetical protein